MTAAPQTALVTGGSGGIGFEVARALALTGARVLIISRKEDNAERAIMKMKESAPEGQHVDITFAQCDLGSFGDIQLVSKRVRDSEKRLDLVRSPSATLRLTR